jgi:hypothetical protein
MVAALASLFPKQFFQNRLEGGHLENSFGVCSKTRRREPKFAASIRA